MRITGGPSGVLVALSCASVCSAQDRLGIFETAPSEVMDVEEEAPAAEAAEKEEEAPAAETAEEDA